MTEHDSKKEVARQMVVFKKEGPEYYIYLAIQGYETRVNGLLFSEHLPLGRCGADELESMIHVFKCCNHNIEVCLDVDGIKEVQS